MEVEVYNQEPLRINRYYHFVYLNSILDEPLQKYKASSMTFGKT